MSRKRRPAFLIVRLRLHPDDIAPDVVRRPWRLVASSEADDQSSLYETAAANRRRHEPARDAHGAGYPRSFRQTETPEPTRPPRPVPRWRGTGPRNYIRSDIRMQEDVSDLFTDDAALDASNIEVSVTRSEVLLQGFVDSKWARRHAEDLADSVPGITFVQNNLRIQAPGTSYARSVGGPDGSEPAPLPSRKRV